MFIPLFFIIPLSQEYTVKTYSRPNEYEETLKPGVYRFEVWGGSAASDTGKYEIYGGYTIGEIAFSEDTVQLKIQQVNKEGSMAAETAI